MREPIHHDMVYVISYRSSSEESTVVYRNPTNELLAEKKQQLLAELEEADLACSSTHNNPNNSNLSSSSSSSSNPSNPRNHRKRKPLAAVDSGKGDNHSPNSPNNPKSTKRAHISRNDPDYFNIKENINNPNNPDSPDKPYGGEKKGEQNSHHLGDRNQSQPKVFLLGGMDDQARRTYTQVTLTILITLITLEITVITPRNKPIYNPTYNSDNRDDPDMPPGAGGPRCDSVSGGRKWSNRL